MLLRSGEQNGWELMATESRTGGKSGVVLPFRWNPKLDQDIKRIRVINAELRVILHSAWAEKKIKNGEGDQKNQANDQVDAGIPPGFGGRCQDND